MSHLSTLYNSEQLSWQQFSRGIGAVVKIKRITSVCISFQKASTKTQTATLISDKVLNQI